MKGLLWAILIVLLLGAGLIVWQVWDAKAKASADDLRDTQARLTEHEAAQRHQLLYQRYELAQVIWSDSPERVRLYKACVDLEESMRGSAFGDTPNTDKNCKKLDKIIDRTIAKR